MSSSVSGTRVGAVSALVPLVSPKLGIMQHRTIGKYDLVQAARGIAVFGGVHCDGYVIPRRDGLLRPTNES